MGQLHYKCNHYGLLVTCSITNEQNHNVIDYDYIESNHDSNRDCIKEALQWRRAKLHQSNRTHMRIELKMQLQLTWRKLLI